MASKQTDLFSDRGGAHAHVPRPVRSEAEGLLAYQCSVCFDVVVQCPCGNWHTRKSKFCGDACSRKDYRNRQQNALKGDWER